MFSCLVMWLICFRTVLFFDVLGLVFCCMCHNFFPAAPKRDLSTHSPPRSSKWEGQRGWISFYEMSFWTHSFMLSCLSTMVNKYLYFQHIFFPFPPVLLCIFFFFFVSWILSTWLVAFPTKVLSWIYQCKLEVLFNYSFMPSILNLTFVTPFQMTSYLASWFC